MNRALAVCLLLPLLLGLMPAHSQSSSQAPVGQPRLPRPFEDVPADHWAYNDQYALADADIPHAYYYTGGSRRAWSRAQSAQLIGAMSAPLSASDPTAHQSLLTLLRDNPPALDALLRLVDEFGPELRAQGRDVPAVQKQLADLEETLPTSAASRLQPTVTPVLGTPPAGTIPITDPAHRDVDTLQRAGIVIGYWVGTYSGPPNLSRTQFATAIDRVLPNAEYPYVWTEVSDRLRFDLPALAALNDLVREFQPELQALGQDVPAAQAQIASLDAGRSLTVAPPFPDVPKDHWAYASLEALRKAGLVMGEPGDVYGG